jgi:hypothetical protein
MDKVALCFPYQFSTSALDGGEWSMPFYSQGNSPRYPLFRRLVPEPVWTLWRRESLLSLPANELRPLGRPANSLVSIPSLLSRLDGLVLRIVTSSSYESHSNLRMKKRRDLELGYIRNVQYRLSCTGCGLDGREMKV